MPKFIALLSLYLAALYGIIGNALAQEPGPVCHKAIEAEKILNERGYFRRAIGVDASAKTLMVMYQNEKGFWTIWVVDTQDNMCLAADGSDIHFYEPTGTGRPL
jgi:hypothetical protein